MPRTLAERWREEPWKQAGEQVAHVLLGALAALPAVWGPLPPVLGLCAALIVAGAREWEQRPVASWGDLVVDVAATGVGGLALGLGVWLA